MRMLFSLTLCCVLPPVAHAVEPLRVLAWNIDGENSDSQEILRQLRLRQSECHFDVLVISEVPANDTKPFVDFFAAGAGVAGHRGGDFRLVTAWNPGRLSLVSSVEAGEIGTTNWTRSRLAAPLVTRLRDHLEVGREVYFVNHRLVDDTVELPLQAVDLGQWASWQSLPVILLGDFDPDFDFGGREAHSQNLMVDDFGTMKWAKPEPLVDSHWVDGDADALDDNPHSLSDFVFYNGQKQLKVSVEILIRRGDFPDDEKTSDHRPALVTIE